ncbi:hypothetical protein T4E_6486 [Trichinella pseudospiralis]|uniref:Uncharacterized protein n=1 Tax=Trichinella pseudospiralis TaxID=6337 RepID=A0A0V0Y1U9_TRIPS|nr:hypothetical protein T4E_6486 [Trichinella pseudospiralis]
MGAHIRLLKAMRTWVMDGLSKLYHYGINNYPWLCGGRPDIRNSGLLPEYAGTGLLLPFC